MSTQFSFRLLNPISAFHLILKAIIDNSQRIGFQNEVRLVIKLKIPENFTIMIVV